MPPSGQSSGLSWLLFAALTFCSWGLYGPMLHVGSMAMKDAENGRYKAFLFVGVAYFLVAILGPVMLLLMRGAQWNFPADGWKWSLIAGGLGAIGAFTLLLSLGTREQPPNVIMSVVFAGAPIVTSIYVLAKEGTFSQIKLPFVLGVLMAAAGGCLVALYRPDPPAGHAHAPAAIVAPADTAAKEIPAAPASEPKAP